jgi:putative tributyrin esterase
MPQVAKTLRVLVAICGVFLLLSCKDRKEISQADSPRLTANVTMRDVTFHSAALNRSMQYRVVLPASLTPGQRLPVIYLLHGGGGGFRDWTNYSDVARFAERGLVLVMPEGGSSYYTNSAEHSQDRYEDYIATDLISDVESKFPVAADRANRAIVGVSMGGFGAVKLALRHPELYAFAGGISPAIDVPSRPFSIKRPGQWLYHQSIFGSWGSQHRHSNDPFVLAQSADPATAPYFYVSCGEQEGLLPANRKFAALLVERRFSHEFHTVPGGHNWTQWNNDLPALFASLFQHVRASTPSPLS